MGLPNVLYATLATNPRTILECANSAWPVLSRPCLARPRACRVPRALSVGHVRRLVTSVKLARLQTRRRGVASPAPVGRWRLWLVCPNASSVRPALSPTRCVRRARIVLLVTSRRRKARQAAQHVSPATLRTIHRLAVLVARWGTAPQLGRNAFRANAALPGCPIRLGVKTVLRVSTARLKVSIACLVVCMQMHFMPDAVLRATQLWVNARRALAAVTTRAEPNRRRWRVWRAQTT